MRRGLAGAAIAAALVLAGCGGGSDDQRDAPDEAAGGMRAICLEMREGVGIEPIMRGDCRKAGVTETSPPPDSAEARAAARRDRELGEQIERESAERPTEQMQRRSAALLSYSEGNRAAAERELEEGCPKASAEELSAAWWELRRLADSGGGVGELRQGLRELCPL